LIFFGNKQDGRQSNDHPSSCRRRTCTKNRIIPIYAHNTLCGFGFHSQDGSIKEFEANFSLLSPFICDAIATKDDRRTRRSSAVSSDIPSSSSSGPAKADISNGSSSEAFPEDKNGSIRPSIITLK
jgi:hypothetical protein